MKPIEFVTRPAFTVEEVQLTFTRTEWHLDMALVCGILPVPVVRTEQVPDRTVSLPGKTRTEPFWVRNWPHPLGVKIDNVEIEGIKLNGVFAFEHNTEEDTFLCSFDWMPKNDKKNV